MRRPSSRACVSHPQAITIMNVKGTTQVVTQIRAPSRRVNAALSRSRQPCLGGLGRGRGHESPEDEELVDAVKMRPQLLGDLCSRGILAGAPGGLTPFSPEIS